ncbi:MAG: uridine kinase [Frankiaceae bacterium]
MTEPYDDIAASVLAAPARLGPVRLVTVDGPAGSGKTTFAAGLVAALVETAVVVHMDDLYEGWHDIEDCWPRVEEWLLAPLGAGRPARVRHYDWPAGRWGEDWHDVGLPVVLVLEGVGAGRRAVADETTLAVWVEAPRDLGLARGVERDGEALRGEWLRWQAEEADHFAREGTRERAQLLVDGTRTGTVRWVG